MSEVIGTKIIEVKADASGAVKELKKVEDAAKKTGGGISTALKEGGSGFRGLAAAFSGGLSNDLLDAKEAITGLIKGFGAVKAAAYATGIGLLVAGVVALVSNWEKVIGATFKASDAAKQNLVLAEQNVKAQKDKLQSISDQENILKLQGKSEREILEMKIAQTDEVIKAQEAQLIAQEEIKRQQMEAAKRNQGILQGLIDFVTAPIQVLLNGIDKVAKLVGIDSSLGEAFREFKQTSIFDPAEVAAENDAVINETRATLDKLKNDRAGLQLSLNAIDKKGAEDRAKIREQADAEEQKRRDEKAAKDKAFNEERAARELADEQRQTDLIKAIAEARYALNTDAQQKEIDAVKSKYDAMRELAKGNSEQLSEIQFLENTELLNLQAARTEEEKKIEAEKQNAIAEMKRKQIESDVALTASGLDALSNLTALFEGKSIASQKRAFKVNKAFNIAKALVTTYQSATAAYQSQLTATPDSPIRAAIAAGVAIASGLAQVRNIQKTSFDGGEAASAPSGGGGGGGSISGGSEASQQTQTPFNPFAGGNFGQPQAQPIQAYVLTGNVTSGQNAQQKIDELATL